MLCFFKIISKSIPRLLHSFYVNYCQFGATYILTCSVFIFGFAFQKKRHNITRRFPIQPVLTCSKSSLKTPEQLVNLFKFDNKNIGTISMMSFRCLYFWLWKNIAHSFVVFFVYLEWINTSWMDCRCNSK